MCLTPTQETMTCDMIRRKTKKNGEPAYDMQGVWEHPCTQTQWTRVQGMPCMGMQRGTCKGCCGFTLLPHVRRCFA